nr:hypothetical protein [Tanacetum cinerariifolium]
MRSTTLATYMEQSIEGQSRDLVDQAYIKVLLAHIMLMEVAMPIHKSRNLSYKRLPTFITCFLPVQEKEYYLNKDQEKEKLRNIFPFIALLEQNPDTYKSKDTTDSDLMVVIAQTVGVEVVQPIHKM